MRAPGTVVTRAVARGPAPTPARRLAPGLALGLLLAGAACVGSSRPLATTAGTTTADSPDDDAAPFIIPPIDNTAPPASKGPSFADFRPQDVVSFQFGSNDGIAGVTAQITANSTANACADVTANVLRVGSSQLAIVLKDLSDPGVVAGTYVYPAAANAPLEIVSATFAVVTSACALDDAGPLVSGTVVLTKVQAGSQLQGSYTLAFAAGTLSGSFSAPTCAALGLTPSTAPTCPASAAP